MSLLLKTTSPRTTWLHALAILSIMGVGAPMWSPARAQTSPASPQVSAPASFADMVERVRGAVVSVKVNVVETGAGQDGALQNPMPRLLPGDPLERFFRQFGGESGLPFERPARPKSSQALGSGFLISEDGYVVTNHHVIEHAADITIMLDDGRHVAADVVGADPRTDLALLKIKEKGSFPHVAFARDVPRVGDWVIAVGNPFGLGGTVTAGIVSARGRDIGAGPYDDFLQIDAPVNRGNSGGPTFNTRGEVVGVNTAIFSPSGGSVGIGFAIPAEVARDVVAALRQKGAVARGWIGVQIQPVTPQIAETLGATQSKGALVADLQMGSPAGAAGLRAGDMILAVNGERVDSPRDLARKIASFAPDQKVDVTYWRDGREHHAQVKLGILPQHSAQRAERREGSEREGSVEHKALARLGLTLVPAAALSGTAHEGVVVAHIDPNGLAAQARLKPGDVILEVAGHKVERPADVSLALAKARTDGRRALLLRVKTGETLHFIAMTPVG